MTATRTTPSGRARQASAVVSREIEPRGFGPIPRARIAALFDNSRLPKLKFLDRLANECRERDRLRAARLSAGAELSGLVSSLNSTAQAEQWSQRELARRLKLAWTTWGRIYRAEIDPLEWLPKVRAAASRVEIGGTASYA